MLNVDNTIIILLIAAAFIIGLALGSSNIDDLFDFEEFSPDGNVIISLNANSTTFSATTCKDTIIDGESATIIAGKFNNGNFALDSVDIGVGLIDTDGNVVNDSLITLYDLNPNETRFFDEIFYDVTDIWETCEFQVEYASEN